MARVLLLGAAGQLGRELVKALEPEVELISLTRHEADLTNPDALRRAIQSNKPEFVINAAAYTAVDRAEKEPELARAVNAIAPGIIAEEARSARACLLHFSTDYVFDGSNRVPWKETDAPHPLNVYGQTKLEGEQNIANSGCRYFIFRTSWVYASHGSNFLLTMLRLGSEQKRLTVVDDQIGCPTSAREIARGTGEIVKALKRGDETESGVYHMACSGSTSWFGFAQAIFAHGGLANPVPELIAVPSEKYQTAAQRPRYSVLDCEKLHRTLSVRLANWEDALIDVLAELDAQRPSRV